MLSYNFKVFLTILVLFLLTQDVHAHGFMEFPCQRGTLNPRNKQAEMCHDKNAPNDYKKHFPAGDKTSTEEAGDRSLREAAGGKWTPFEPLKKNFLWRSGVCGDLKKGSQDHMKGGKYYYNGKVVADYQEGGVIDVSMKIIAHHNGFVELHLCDVEKCGGEISEDCFRNGYCYQLKRAPNKECDSGKDMDCGPIDSSYPGRWYLPCPQVSINRNVWRRYGGKKMQFLLPQGLSCKHCVLHWYWATGHTCNTPGTREYFDGPNGPKWGSCRGQGHSTGGIAQNAKDCGPTRFPQEYYQCADISIESSGNSPNAGQVPLVAAVTTPTPMIQGTSMQGSAMESQGKSSGSFTGIAVVADDNVIVESVLDNQQIDVSGYRKVALEAVKSDKTGPVAFYIDGEKVWTDRHDPFFLYGNRGRSPSYKKRLPFNKEFSVEAMASDGSIKVSLTL